MNKMNNVIELGKKNGWECIDYQDSISLLRFKNNEKRINVYLTKMTVSTALNHPSQGKTQLFRKNVTFDELDGIFKNPRIHTNKGYQRK